ncbi:major facilitator superfamily domain-containing protein 9-like [Zerene cesonia]|uniref:major facilitator superfamily domain-containing protein 9-like n=1 Tax=Zerene cesonia TaxID=33412 RepID=UPI0018E59BEF|nr:major facilitator superfamily domain-containing protein 9-like [Zerene cesonia]
MTYTISIIKLVAFLDLLAVGLIVPLIPNHVRQMGGNQLYIGLLGSMYSGFQLGSGPLIGSLSDLKGCRNILIYTLLICSTAYVALGLTTSVIVIIILRAILGLFKQTQLLTKALVPEYEKDEKKQSVIFGKMAAISGMGMTLGPVIGGHIAEDFPENGFFYISLIVATVFIVNAGCVNMLPKTSIKIKKNAAKKNPEHNFLQLIYFNSKQSVEELTKVEWSQYWDMFIFKALLGFSMGVYYSNYALYLKTQYDLTPKHVGYVISLQGIIGAVSSFSMGYINSYYPNDQDFSVRNYHVFLLLSISILGLCLSYNIFIYTLWLVPMSIGNAVGRLVTLEMILRKKDKEHKGTLIGASNSIASLSGVLSPMAAGLIGHYLGVKYVIYASLSSNVLALVLSYRYKSRHQKVE